jgi:hypothetical protein
LDDFFTNSSGHPDCYPTFSIFLCAKQIFGGGKREEKAERMFDCFRLTEITKRKKMSKLA